MGKKEKLIDRLKSKPKDFQWNNAAALLQHFGYECIKGSGSRRKFFNRKTGAKIFIHEPHPGSILKEYQVNDILSHLKEQGYI